MENLNIKKISIPEKIYLEFNKLDKIFLEGIKCDTLVYSIPIPSAHVKVLNFVELISTFYEKVDKFCYRLVYKNGSIEHLVYKNKEQLLAKNINFKRHLKKNLLAPFRDTLEGMNECLDQVNNKIADTKILSKTPIGIKNLIYYTVFGDSGYVDLLELSINSILSFPNKIFWDFLIITDKETKTKINQIVFSKPINLHFLILDTPSDGVEASKCKIRLYDWEFIDEYQNILFLDTDIVAIENIDSVFDACLENNVVYTAYGQNPNTLDFRNYYHGFEILSKEFVQEMKNTKQQPFNAGQFLFKNSKIMRAHFTNINWFMENWPGEYFFEQSFMCYYFAKARCIQDNLLSLVDFCSLETITLITQIKPTTVLLHFAGEALNAVAKLDYIRKHLAHITSLKLTKNGAENNFLG